MGNAEYMGNYCLFLVVFIVCSISRVTFLPFSLSLALLLVLISRRPAKRQTMPWILPACILNAFDSFLYLSLHLSRVLCVNNTCQQKKKKAPFIWRKLIINHVLTPNRNNNRSLIFFL